MMTASHRIIRFTCLRLMPTARSSPSSRVRSKIDRPSVFAIPKSAIITAIVSIAVTSPSSWFTNPACCSRNAVWSWTWTLPNSSSDDLDRRLHRGRIGALVELDEDERVELLAEERVVGVERDHVVARRAGCHRSCHRSSTGVTPPAGNADAALIADRPAVVRQRLVEDQHVTRRPRLSRAPSLASRFVTWSIVAASTPVMTESLPSTLNPPWRNWRHGRDPVDVGGLDSRRPG